MPIEQAQTYEVICQGGLNSNKNYLDLSDNAPGSATTLVNFESSLYGGYRRLDGYESLNSNASHTIVDAAAAEGKIFSVSLFEGEIIATRKQIATNTYKFYRFVDGSAWSAYATGLTHTSTNVNKIRSETYNLTNEPSIIFVDGVNKAVIFNGTTWTDIDSAASGANYANAGGNQAIDAPSLVESFRNHLFLAGDPATPQIIAHSAPSADYDWLAASGAGQINAGFDIKAIKAFRDELYVFGETRIRKVVVEGSDFVIKDVAHGIGCLAPDSVQEVNGDLIYLAQDGFRTIAGTTRNQDVELGALSKNIQQDVIDLITTAELLDVNSVVIRRKSQVRFFFSDENQTVANSVGIIACLKGSQDGTYWEWSRLKGIRTTACVSGYIGPEEYVLHGDFDGGVYRQEQGTSFAGANIRTSYTMPYLDFGDVFMRKTIKRIKVFIRAEGEVVVNAAVQYDWDDRDVSNPAGYLLEREISGTTYGTGIYGTSIYATITGPYLLQAVEGSGFSTRITFSTSDTNASYSIQGIVFEFMPNGRK